jgi:hypothetical protein
MNPRINKAQALNDYKFQIEFENGEIGVFDLSPYLGLGMFKELKEDQNYRRFSLEEGVLTWFNGLDIGPDTVYLDSKKHN